MIAIAPYLGVLAGVVCLWIYLRLSTVPVAPSGWRTAKVAQGDCPVEFCGGVTSMSANSGFSTLWKCEKCKAAYILSSIPGE